jgi:hypothetical protein
VKRFDLNDLMLLVGALLATAGVALLSVAWALILAGVLLMAYGTVRDLT